MKGANEAVIKEPVGPYARVKTPTNVERAMENLSEAEKIADRKEAGEAARAKAKREAKTDKIAKVLGTKVYTTDKTWPFLKREVAGREYQLSVSHYYMEINVAVDKFYTDEDYRTGNSDLKKKLLNANGIKYVALHPGNSLADMEAELDAQEKVGS